MSRVMAKIFHGENGKICIYLDDCICMSNGFDQHLSNLRALLNKMRQHDLKLKPSKCFFAQEKVSFLGHQVSKDGIVPDPERTKAIREFPVPTTVKAVRGFLGFCGFYRRFIQNFSTIARPLNTLLKKNVPFTWGQPQQSAFNTLKDKVLNPPILCHYDPEATLILRTDSSGYGLGGHLIQVPSYERKSERRLLACASRTISNCERNYGVSELECLSIVWSFEKFHSYLYGPKKFIVETDYHALCYLMKTKNINGRLCRWSLLLQAYNFDIHYNAGANHADADCLSRFPLPASIKDLDKEYFQNSVLQPSVFAYDVYQHIKSSEEGSPYPTLTTELPDLAEEQRSDDYFRTIIASVIQQKENEIQNHYVIHNDLLYRRTEKDGEVNYALCIPQSRVKDVLIANHDCPLAGHSGRNKTYARIQQKYFWKSMYRDVQNYVNTCKACQAYKSSNQQRQGLYQPLPVPERPFQEIAMDLIGPIKRTKTGNLYILSIVCRLTKFAFDWPLANIRDTTVMRVFQDQFLLKYGICEKLLTDRGSNICSDYSESIYKSYGIKHITTTAGHPECNGQVENFNKFITACVAIQCGTTGVEWDDCLADTVYTYNTSVNDSTRMTPYYLVFGVKARNYLDNIFQWEELRECDVTRDEQIAKVVIARQKARKDTEKSQLKNMNRVNQKRGQIEFNVGDRVLLEMKHLKLSKGGKLKPKFSGPYVVLKKISPLTYRLTQPKGSYKSSIVHVKRLKLYRRRETDSENEIGVSSGSDADNEDNAVDSDTEVYWQSEMEQPIQSPQQRPKRTTRRPKNLKDFVCCLYNLIN